MFDATSIWTLESCLGPLQMSQFDFTEKMLHGIEMEDLKSLISKIHSLQNLSIKSRIEPLQMNKINSTPTMQIYDFLDWTAGYRNRSFFGHKFQKFSLIDYSTDLYSVNQERTIWIRFRGEANEREALLLPFE